MSYPPQQPGGWSDPSWPTQPQPGQPQPGQPTSGQPSPYPYDPNAQPPYGGYGYPGYGPPVPPSQQTNGLAIASLVCSLAGLFTCISAPVGAVLGHIAKKQIRERGEGGEGLAQAGIIIGWILTGLGIVGCGLWVVLVVWAANNQDTNSLGSLLTQWLG
jgi:hypothetical protein